MIAFFIYFNVLSWKEAFCSGILCSSKELSQDKEV